MAMKRAGAAYVIVALLSAACPHAIPHAVSSAPRQLATADVDPCTDIDPAFLEYLRRTKRKERLPDSIKTIDGRLVLIFTEQPGGRQRLLPLTPMSQMTDSPSVVIPTTIDPSVLKFHDYIDLGMHIGSTVYLAPSTAPATAVLTPPLTVDRRVTGEIRNQGDRDTCVAHAALAALERLPNVPDDLSEEDAHHYFMTQLSTNCCADSGVRATDAVGYLGAHGVPEENIWTYSSKRPSCATNLTCKNPAHQPPTQAATRYRIKDATVIGRQPAAASITNPAYLETLISQGYDVVAAVFMRPMANSESKGILDVIMDGDKPYCPKGGHALLLIGYDHDAQYFIARDSYGTTWGQAGYLYLGYDYMRLYGRYGFFIKEVEVDTP